jgi:transcriptional regulator with XRE-family HTH domain
VSMPPVPPAWRAAVRATAVRYPDRGVVVKKQDSYAQALGARLRAVRVQRGWTLPVVEKVSRGRWKVAAVGSYERGDRMISFVQLCELAAFYTVPVGELLPDGPARAPLAQGARIVVNLQLLRDAPDAAGRLRRFTGLICRQRGDYNGRVLSLRGGDLRTLAVLYDTTPDDLTERLREWNVLVDPPSTPPSPAPPSPAR